MEFTYNGQTYKTPAQLCDITLAKYIAFQETYGYMQNQRLETAKNIADAKARTDEVLLQLIDRNVQTFSFYTGIPLAEVMANFSFDQVMKLTSVNGRMLSQEMREATYKRQYLWQDEEWTISPPVLLKDRISYDEYNIALDMGYLLLEFSDSNWRPMLKLCAAYIRKKDEAYSPDFILDGSPRMQLMESLPMDFVASLINYFADTKALYLESIKNGKQ